MKPASSTVRTMADALTWFEGACAAFTDPSDPVCQLFFRWRDDLEGYDGDELVCGVLDGELTLSLGPLFPPFPVRVADAPEIDEAGTLIAFGAESIAPGVWALTPSLLVPGWIHGFVVLYGVPQPAFWERRIILPGDVGWELAA